MRLELKKVRIIPCMSEETTCFHATLYVDGKKAADCSNTGKGGMTVVSFHDTGVRDAVVAYCNDNPVVNVFRGKVMVFHGVDVRVDELLVEHQMKKELKSRQKTSLVLHNNRVKDPQYVIHSFLNLRQPVDRMLADETGQQFLRVQIESFRRKGFTVMNDNIDYRALGVRV